MALPPPIERRWQKPVDRETAQKLLTLLILQEVGSILALIAALAL
jgi:hypothetical protein